MKKAIRFTAIMLTMVMMFTMVPTNILAYEKSDLEATNGEYNSSLLNNDELLSNEEVINNEEINNEEINNELEEVEAEEECELAHLPEFPAIAEPIMVMQALEMPVVFTNINTNATVEGVIITDNMIRIDTLTISNITPGTQTWRMEFLVSPIISNVEDSGLNFRQGTRVENGLLWNVDGGREGIVPPYIFDYMHAVDIISSEGYVGLLISFSNAFVDGTQGDLVLRGLAWILEDGFQLPKDTDFHLLIRNVHGSVITEQTIFLGTSPNNNGGGNVTPPPPSNNYDSSSDNDSSNWDIPESNNDRDITITSNPSSPWQVTNVIENQLNNNTDNVVMTLARGATSVNINRRALDMLITANAGLLITSRNGNGNASVTFPQGVISQFRNSAGNALFNLSAVPMDAPEGAFAAINVSASGLGHNREVARFNDNVVVSVNLGNARIPNADRLVAIDDDGNRISGSFDPVTRVFEFETGTTGNFIIRH